MRAIEQSDPVYLQMGMPSHLQEHTIPGCSQFAALSKIIGIQFHWSFRRGFKFHIQSPISCSNVHIAILVNIRCHHGVPPTVRVGYFKCLDKVPLLFVNIVMGIHSLLTTMRSVIWSLLISAHTASVTNPIGPVTSRGNISKLKTTGTCNRKHQGCQTVNTWHRSASNE